MTMPEILRRKLMERIDIASEPDDGEVLEEIDGLILGEEETRYLPVAQKAELRRQLFYSVRRLDVLQELLEDAGITEIMVHGYQHIFVERNRQNREIRQKLYLRRKAGGCDSADCRPMQPRGE
jgi:Flp pilus assembly protein, ATPase CpaF